MTCIAAVEHDGKVYIGGDSAGVAGLALTVRADEKVFANGPYVMGFTSSFRMGQLLRYSFTPPDHDPRVDDMRFMCTTFVDAVRSCLKNGGYAKTSDGRESAGTFLVGYQGVLYCMDSDFQIGRTVHGFDAVGCGDDLAKGALAASGVKDPTKRIEQALGVAEAWSAGVRGPFTVVSA